MDPTATDWIQAGSAVFTMIAAFSAAVIAAKGPRLAAKYAEEYRRINATLDEQAKFQTDVFRALMKGRNEIMSPDSRAAINLVESAFPNNNLVRNARRMFTKAATAQPFEATIMVKCYLDLIEEVAKAVGLGDSINRFDIESGYYPSALGRIDEAAILDAERRIAEASSLKPKP